MSEVSTKDELQQYLNTKNYTAFLKNVNSYLNTLKDAQQWMYLIECVLNKVDVLIKINNKLAASQVLTEYRLLVTNYGTTFQKIAYYNLLATAYEGLGQREKVFSYLKKAEQLAKEHQVNELLPLIYNNMSRYYFDEHLQLSMDYAKKSAELNVGKTDEHAQASIIHYVRLLLAHEQLPEAKRLLQSLEPIMNEQAITNETILFWNVQATYLEKQGKLEEAYTFLKAKLSSVAEFSKWCEVLYEEICRLSKLCNSEQVYIEDLKNYLTVKNNVLALQNSEQLQLLEAHFDDTTLKRLAYTDTLTQLPNRRYLEDIYKRIQPPFAAFILDIDSFKKINDSEGHLVGDDVLKNVVSVLLNALQGIPVQFVRLGGDEFFGIIESPANKELEVTVMKMVQAVRTIRLPNEGRFVCPTISLGACHVTEELALEQVMQLADEALYEAKARGKNQYAVCNGGVK